MLKQKVAWSMRRVSKLVSARGGERIKGTAWREEVQCKHLRAHHHVILLRVRRMGDVMA